MNSGLLLQDLAVIMTVAAVVMFICHRLKQPSVIGYLLAGFIVGPFTPPFALVSDIASIRSISQLGLIFIMFSLGLDFNLPRLRKAGVAVAVAASIVVTGMLLTGFMLGRVMGWSTPACAFLGAMLSISGSSLIAKVFFDMRLTSEPFARSVFGIMICDDIAAMIMLSVISGLGAHSGLIALDATTSFVRIMFFIMLFLILGLLIVPKVLASVTRFRNTEMTGICVLALCFASALLASHFGFSLALGTFLIGAIIAATDHIDSIEDWVRPLRDMFSALFFVSAGMLVNPRILIANWLPVTIITTVAVIGRMSWGTLASLAVGRSNSDSVKIGASIAQLGEFSFIIVAAGAGLGLISDTLYSLAVAISTLTAFIAPLLIRHSRKIEEKLFLLAPAGANDMLARYRDFLERTAAPVYNEGQQSVFSKYMLRLGMYVTLLAGLFYAGGFAASVLDDADFPRVLIPAWVAFGVLCVPLFLSIARYCDHMLLISLTIVLARFSPVRLMQKMNISYTYKVINYFLLTMFGLLFLFYASPKIDLPAGLMFVAAPALVISFMLKNQIASARNSMELMLDQVIGLATSEPQHQSVFARPREQVLLCTVGFAAAKKRISVLEVKTKTGATVVAIYRNGKTIAAPAPQTVFTAHDIAIVFGPEEQRKAAARLLAHKKPDFS
ncbi:MAG: cation:proton antiporter [Elusimicrobiaceae bacterium]|nr:cation:proton antiporter [Elusimicrobiaceae bacterium]